MYNYFLPTVREFMFKSFGFADSTTRIFNSLGIKLKANMLENTPCAIFEYSIGEDIQAKTDNEDRNIFQNTKNRTYLF